MTEFIVMGDQCFSKDDMVAVSRSKEGANRSSNRSFCVYLRGGHILKITCSVEDARVLDKFFEAKENK